MPYTPPTDGAVVFVAVARVYIAVFVVVKVNFLTIKLQVIINFKSFVDENLKYSDYISGSRYEFLQLYTR